jgi:hypothetical protein
VVALPRRTGRRKLRRSSNQQVTHMGRLIAVVIALGLVGWLAMKQLNSVGSAAHSKAPPREIAADVGRQVDAQVQAGKARTDEQVEAESQ